MPKVEVKDNHNNITITLNGDTGDISAGASGSDGDLIVRNTKGTERIRLDGQTGRQRTRSETPGGAASGRCRPGRARRVRGG